MAITSISSGSEAANGTELAETLNARLAEQIPTGAGVHLRSGAAIQAKPINPAPITAPTQHIEPTQDVASTLFQEIASSDLSKLGQILQPPETGETVKVLDNLLKQAIEQVATGNAGRAVGFLADYATRDPKRAEDLVGMKEFEPVRPQLDTLLGQMTTVAKMSAEDSLAKAGHTAEEVAGKLPTWDTKPDVLVKLAQKLYDSGGYANYTRTNELARALTSDAESVKANPQAVVPQGQGMHGMQAMSAAQGVAAAGVMVPGVMVPGVTVPYLVTPYASSEISVGGFTRNDPKEELRRARAAASAAARENWEDFREVVRQVVSQVWDRAPLLVMMVAWLSLGIAGGISASVLRQLSPDNPLLDLSDIGFEAWGIGFLALVGFGFVMRVRRARY